MATTAYCVVSDITSAFPRFQRAQTGNVQDADIQGWIDDAGAYIYALFLARGIDLNLILSLTAQQTNVLRKLNRESGVKDLASVLRYNTSAGDMGAFGAATDAPRSPLTASRFRDGRFDEVTTGVYDALFSPGSARHISIGPGMKGSIAGGDQDPTESAAARGLPSVAFTKNQVF